MWPTGSKCISWVGPLNKVIPRLIQFHMRRFSQSSTPHIPLHIKSNPWFYMTLQLSLGEIFFSPFHHWETLCFTAKRDVAKHSTREPEHDLSIWQWSHQRPHTHMKRHRWELCHPAKHPAELTTLVQHRVYQRRRLGALLCVLLVHLRGYKVHRGLFFSPGAIYSARLWLEKWWFNSFPSLCGC